jgi:MFS family permease
VTDLAPVPSLAEDGAGLPGPSIGEAVTPRGERRPFRAFRHREFRLLFVAYGVGDLGFWISHISLQAEMARITDNSSLWLGALFFTTFIPMLLFAPVAGVLADRVDRKKMLMVTRGCVGIIAACLSVVVLSDLDPPPVLAVFGFAIGTLFAFMAPAAQAATANSVPNADLSSAVSLEATGTNISRIAGPALAAPILVAWGAGWSFAVYALSNVIMLFVLAGVRLRSHIDTTETGTAWERWKQGLNHARERPPAIAVLVTMGVFSVFGAAHVALLPVFATKVLHHSRDDFTLLVSASGVGAIFGSVTTGARRTLPTLRTAACWLVGFGIMAGAFSFSRSWELSLVLIAGVGFFYFSTTTSLNTILQHLADDEKRGRIMGLFAVAWAGLIPLGGIWMGGVADIGGAPLAVGLGAAVCIAVAFVVFAMPRFRTQPARAAGQASTVPPR